MISAYVLAFNEQEKVGAAISTLRWADEIVVVDSGSTDATARIASEMGARVVQVPFNGFGVLRNSALEHCRGDWIFSLDSDERCTAAVRDEVLRVTAGDSKCQIYQVPRRNWFLGRWIRHSGWYPNYRQPQLFRRGALRYTTEPVHEGWENLSGAPVGQLENAIWQVPFRTLDEVVRKVNRYSTLGAEKLAGRQIGIATIFSHALWAFVKHYIFKRGILDGWPGFVIAFQSMEGTFWRYAKRMEMNRNAPAPVVEPVDRTAAPAGNRPD